MTFDYIIGCNESQKIGAVLQQNGVKRYNYKGASDLFKRYYDLACDPWQLTGDEKQAERRQFMHAVTRRNGIKLYIDFLYYLIDEARPCEDQKSRCFDFDYERQLENLIYEIKTFKGTM